MSMGQVIDQNVAELKFRDPVKARQLAHAIELMCEQIGRTVSVMHVCGSHEQAIAKYGLRSIFTKKLDVIMGPGCPVCVTDLPEVDEAVALAEQGITVATYGDMLRVPGTVRSLAEAQAVSHPGDFAPERSRPEAARPNARARVGGRVESVFTPSQAVELARDTTDEVVFFASGFETTAVATAAIALKPDLPPNFSILSAHKYIPPVMEIVAEMPHTRVQGYLAAGHAAAITGWGIFERFVEEHEIPVVVAGFEPLDILAGLAKLVELIRDGKREVVNMYPRCVSYEGNRNALEQLWRVFRPTGGRWRGIAHVPNGNLRLRDEFAHLDTRKRFDIDLRKLWNYAPSQLTQVCICGEIMAGIAAPTNCPLYGKECVPDSPVGACMVSSEGTCRIWHTYGGHPDLGD